MAEVAPRGNIVGGSLMQLMADDPFASGYREVLDTARRAPAASPQNIPATFGETFTPAFDMVVSEEQSVSEGNWWARQIDARNRAVGEVLGLDATPESLVNAYRMHGRNAMRSVREMLASGEITPLDDGSGFATQTPRAEAWVQSFPDAVEAAMLIEEAAAIDPARIQSDDYIQEAIADMARILRESNQADLSRPKTVGGAVGQFAGAALGFVTDPLIAGTMLVGAGSIRGPSIAANAAKAFGLEASIATAAEVPIQASVFGFKERIDSPWTMKDAAMNVLMAAVGAGGARAAGSAAIDSVGAAMARWNALPQAARTPEGQWAFNVLEQVDEFGGQPAIPFRRTPEAEQRHWEAIELARAQIDAGVPVDVTPLTRGLEVAPGVRRAEVPDDAVTVPTRIEEPVAHADGPAVVEPPRFDADQPVPFRADDGIYDEAEVAGLLADVQRAIDEGGDFVLPDRIEYGPSGEMTVVSRTAREQFDEMGQQREALDGLILCVRGGS